MHFKALKLVINWMHSIKGDPFNYLKTAGAFLPLVKMPSRSYRAAQGEWSTPLKRWVVSADYVLAPVKSLSQEEDHVTSFVASEDGAWLVIGWRSLLLKQYDVKTWECKRSWKASTLYSELPLISGPLF